ncbi:lipoprotein [Spiroplasma endosymbiont of Anurida maritima]|uniref:lipoprotein n=1 Tax=Spiroplasma endosymbiont of Anurida maritima TaxID=2967972 RepID=UPI0036D2B8F0
MKKLLSIFGALGITAISAATVVACASYKVPPIPVDKITDILQVYSEDAKNSADVISLEGTGASFSTDSIVNLRKLKDENVDQSLISEASRNIVDPINAAIATSFTSLVMSGISFDGETSLIEEDNDLYKYLEVFNSIYFTARLADYQITLPDSGSETLATEWLSTHDTEENSYVEEADFGHGDDKKQLKNASFTNSDKLDDGSNIKTAENVSIINQNQLDHYVTDEYGFEGTISKAYFLISFNPNTSIHKDSEPVAFYVSVDM